MFDQVFIEKKMFFFKRLRRHRFSTHRSIDPSIPGQQRLGLVHGQLEGLVTRSQGTVWNEGIHHQLYRLLGKSTVNNG